MTHNNSKSAVWSQNMPGAYLIAAGKGTPGHPAIGQADRHCVIGEVTTLDDEARLRARAPGPAAGAAAGPAAGAAARPAAGAAPGLATSAGSEPSGGARAGG